MLLVCTFFAGRWSREGELHRARQDAESALQKAVAQEQIAIESQFYAEELKQQLQNPREYAEWEKDLIRDRK
jgi:hypothetical protein